MTLGEKYQSSLDEYIKLFSHADLNKHSILAEGSTYTLYSQNGLKEIRETVRNPKIIVMLRNPIHAAISMFLQTKKGSHLDPCLTFDAAWLKMLERKNTRNTDNSHFAINYQYDELFMYEKHLKILFSIFDKRQVHVMLFDDYIDCTISVIREIFLFLGIDFSFIPKITNINQAGVVRFLWLKNQFDVIARKTIKIRSYLNLNNTGILEKIFISSSEKKINKFKSISTSTRNKMLQHFIPDIEKLEVLFSHDLSHWKT